MLQKLQLVYIDCKVDAPNTKMRLSHDNPYSDMPFEYIVVNRGRVLSVRIPATLLRYGEDWYEVLPIGNLDFGQAIKVDRIHLTP